MIKLECDADNGVKLKIEGRADVVVSEAMLCVACIYEQLEAMDKSLSTAFVDALGNLNEYIEIVKSEG